VVSSKWQRGNLAAAVAERCILASSNIISMMMMIIFSAPVIVVTVFPASLPQNAKKIKRQRIIVSH